MKPFDKTLPFLTRWNDRLNERIFPGLAPVHSFHGTCPQNGPEHGGLLVASYNVHKCVGMDKKFDPDRIAEVIKEIDADIIALQEVDQRFGERSGLLNLKFLERECGLLPVPISNAVKNHGWHGNLLLFRDAVVRDVKQIRLPGVEPRGALVVDTDLTSGPLRIIAAHFGLLRRSRAQQAAAILNAVEAEMDWPTMLMGDLNEWRLGRRSSLLGLMPSFGPLTAAVPSFPARRPVFALDRILCNPDHLIASVGVHDTPLSRVASDHLPVKAWVDLARRGGDMERPLVQALDEAV